MKALIVVIGILFSTTSIANWTSGGGDPKIVEAKAFPNQIKLKAAVDLLLDKIEKTTFNQNFKDAFTTELDSLFKMDRFFYIPELFAVGFNRFPGDYSKLFSNGAMTGHEIGSPIYFSKQAISYDARTLARVVAQELSHHIFKGRFQKDENFANTFGTYLITGKDEPQRVSYFRQVVYEEFDHELRDESSLRIIKKAKNDFIAGHDVLQIIYYTTHDLYKNRGSFTNFHVEYGYYQNKKEMLKQNPKTADISALTKMQKEKIAMCMFADYVDGPSGVTKAFQEKLTAKTVELLKLFKSKIKAFYFTEDFFLPATMSIITDCGFGIESTEGKIMIYKSIDRHEDNQCPLGETCRPF